MSDFQQGTVKDSKSFCGDCGASMRGGQQYCHGCGSENNWRSDYAEPVSASASTKNAPQPKSQLEQSFCQECEMPTEDSQTLCDECLFPETASQQSTPNSSKNSHTNCGLLIEEFGQPCTSCAYSETRCSPVEALAKRVAFWDAWNKYKLNYVMCLVVLVVALIVPVELGAERIHSHVVPIILIEKSDNSAIIELRENATFVPYEPRVYRAEVVFITGDLDNVKIGAQGALSVTRSGPRVESSDELHTLAFPRRGNLLQGILTIASRMFMLDPYPFNSPTYGHIVSTTLEVTEEEHNIIEYGFAPRSQTIEWYEARNHIGQIKTVEAVVEQSTWYIFGGEDNYGGTITFLNMGNAFSPECNDRFQAIIWGDDTEDGSVDRDLIFPHMTEGKRIQVTGTIEEREGVPQIVIRSNSQVRLACFIWTDYILELR